MIKKVGNKFSIQQKVKHVCQDEEDYTIGIITGIILRKTSFHYLVTWGSGKNEVAHFEYEIEPINQTKDIVVKGFAVNSKK